MDLAAEHQDRLQAHLQFLYPDLDATLWTSRFAKLLQDYAGSIPPSEGFRLDESSQWLITYGDMVQRDGATHLQTLRQFLRYYAADIISLVHILPFYPYTSDDGFSVVDYLQVDPSIPILAVGRTSRHYRRILASRLTPCSITSPRKANGFKTTWRVSPQCRAFFGMSIQTWICPS